MQHCCRFIQVTVPEQPERDLEFYPPQDLGPGLLRRLVGGPGEFDGLVVCQEPAPAQGQKDGAVEEARALFGGPMCLGE